MNFRLWDILKYALFALIGFVILYVLWTNQQEAYLEECAKEGRVMHSCSLFQRIMNDFRATKVLWVVTACLIFMLSNVFRAMRWQQLLKPINIQANFFNAFFTLMVGYFVNLGLPRSGEFIRGGLLAKYEKAPFEKVFGTIVTGRIMDFICLAIMLFLGVVFTGKEILNYVATSPLVAMIENHILPIILGAVSFGVLLFILFRVFKKKSNDAEGVMGKIRSVVENFKSGLLSVKDVDSIPLFLFYTGGIWVCYFLMTYLMFFAFEPTSHLTLKNGLLVFDFGSLGIVFPSPGGMGSYHFMIREALNICGINSTDGFSFAMILFFTINIFCNILFGILGLFLLPLFNRKTESL